MTSAGASARSETAGLSIGAVLARLKPEFPDLSISKIRFLEAEELVTPERTGSGYRQFSGNDITRLRFILTAQRDQYLPLKVIKDQLQAIDRGAEWPSSDVVRGGDVLAFDGRGAIGGGVQDAAMSRHDLCEGSGLDEAQLAEAESFGLLEPEPQGGFGPDALIAARTIADLLALGLEPRHLRTLRTTADREAAIVAQLLGPASRRRDPGARRLARMEAATQAAALMRLHAVLVKNALDRELGADTGQGAAGPLP